MVNLEEQMADSVRGIKVRVYETDLYSGQKKVRDASADSEIGYELNQGWFAEQKPATKGLGLTQEEVDWFVNC